MRPFGRTGASTGTDPHAADPHVTSDRTTARLVGGFYLLATVAGVASVVAEQPVLGASDYLAKTHLHENRVVTGALLEMLMGVAVAMVAISFHPVLRRVRERLALSYVVARTVEGASYAVGAVGLLAVVALSRTAPDRADPAVQRLGDLVRAQRDLMGGVMGVGAFSLSAFIVYWVLFRTRLVPRWLSGWGLVAAVPFAIPVLTTAYGMDLSSTTELFLDAPLGIQEMVLAGWLIVRGFDAATLPSAPAPAAGAIRGPAPAQRSPESFRDRLGR